MAKRDQNMRLKSRWKPEIDKENTIKLKRIAAKHGWPTISLVGKNGSHAAWLVVQHSPNLRFQKECLKKMQSAVKIKEVNKRNIAYLTDRILIKEKKNQLFGTQFRLIKNKFEPFPIQNLTDLGRRRRAYELESFGSYAKKFDNEDVSRYKKFLQKPKKHK
jgi:hypothetical protein